MASRFYLPASGSAAVSPTISTEWEHQQGTRRPMSTTKGATALASQAYAPDSADHLVDGDAQHIQFVSTTLEAQTISAQTVTINVKGLMAHANNAQFLTWKLFIWTAAGTVGSTVLAIRRDATAYTTSLINRTDAATTTSVTVGQGDRLVLEVGTGGTPGPAASQVQGHNATLRWGESGATDAPSNDTSTSTTENPWLEFANTLTFYTAPATSGAVSARTRALVASSGIAVSPFPAKGLLDTFQRPNETPLLTTSAWTPSYWWGYYGMELVDGRLRMPAGSPGAQVGNTWLTSSTGRGEVYVTLAVVPVGTSDYLELDLVQTATVSGPMNGYMAVLRGDGGIELYRTDANAMVLLGTATGTPLVAGDGFGLSYSETADTAIVYTRAGPGGSWVQQLTVSDATYGGPWYVDLGLGGITQIDDIGGSDPSAGPTLSASVSARTRALVTSVGAQARRAVVTWAGVTVPGPSLPVVTWVSARLATLLLKGGITVAAERVIGRLATQVRKGGTAVVALRPQSRLAAATQKTSKGVVTIEGGTRLLSVGAPPAATTGGAAVRVAGRVALLAGKTSTALGAARVQVRQAVLAVPKAAVTVAAVRGAVRLAAPGTQGGSTTLALRVASRTAAVAVKAVSAVAGSRAAVRLRVAYDAPLLPDRVGVVAATVGPRLAITGQRTASGGAAARVQARLAITEADITAATDTFDRVNNAASLGTADSGQVWSPLTGTWGISTNRAVVSGTGAHRAAVIDSGVADPTVQVTLNPVDLTRAVAVGLAFRVQDASNFLAFRVEPDQPTAALFKIVGGVFTSITPVTYTPSSTGTLRVECSGTTIKCYVNNTLLITATGITDFQTQTRHGLYSFSSASTTWENFSVAGSAGGPRKASFGAITIEAQAQLAVLAAPRAAIGTAGVLCTVLLTDTASRTAHAVALVGVRLTTELTAVSEFRFYWPPSERLTPVNLGYAYRGDTLVLPIWQAVDQRGNLISLDGATVWFTAKADLADTDVDPLTIQCSTLMGGVEIIDPVLGSYQVTVPADETQQLDDDTKFDFDVQVVTPTPTTHTVRRGVLAVIRDVTRTTA